VGLKSEDGSGGMHGDGGPVDVVQELMHHACK
jgi:hypothetical protein